MTGALLLAVTVRALGGPVPHGASERAYVPDGMTVTHVATGEVRVIRGSYRNAAGERPFALHLPEGPPPPGGRALVVMLKPKEELARLKALRELLERLAPAEEARPNPTAQDVAK